ncbi:ABC transporter substrate-binding protein [Halorussus sp. MSC15.2]|uniref:ABC transporter substrate-binding protein n=1 Tax=Halorussus sp. MSC15.2 TaxID=2283638 RepID=UPI0013D63C9A|nr:ABC transporter substrate-binding protein [Halorussus sp. MSC15.2]NEU58191.1 ABC transporter substrate-binding protein [Halorussus sp. MSC15.2]
MSEKSNMSRRSFLKATGGAASASVITGTAAGQETTTQEDGDGGASGTLNLINTGTMSTLDPIKATDTASGRVIQQMFDALMNYPDGAIEVQTQLAKGYERSDDFTTYTFNLKQGAQFHGDFGEVTAQDFIYSWERLAASDNSRRAYFILDSIGVQHETDSEGNYKPGTLAVEAVDDYTLRVSLEEPFHATLPILAYTSFAALPEGVVGDIQGYDGEMQYQTFATENPVGAGPFQFETWQSNDQAEVSRFPNYHGQTAQVEAVNWRIIEDDNAIYTYAMNRNADYFPIPTPFYDPNKVTVENTDDKGRETGTYGPVRNGATVNYLGVATINAFYIGFNTAQVDKPARQAAAYVMNQQQVIEQIFKGRGQAAYHFTPPNIYPGGPDAYTQHAEQNYPYGYNQTQIQQARQVMEDAGYGPNNQYEFTFTIYSGSDTWNQTAQLLRDQLASAHISMNIESAPFSTLLQRGREGNLQAYSLGWVMDWPAPDNFLQLLNPPQTDTSKDAPISYVNWSGTQAAKQATQAYQKVQNNTAPTDEAEQARNEAYIQIEEANWEDVVFLPVYHETDERFWYQNVDISKFGAAGPSRQMYNTTSIN